MADKPKPPSIAAPKVVPGKETARRIGVDTAFIDGLAAGLVDDEPKAKEAESSGPLFKTHEVDKEAEAEEDDPLGALLPDLPPEGEARPPPSPPSLAPKRKDDLLAALAKESDDADLEVTVPEKKPLPKGDAAPKFEPGPPKAKAEPRGDAPKAKAKDKEKPRAEEPKAKGRAKKAAPPKQKAAAPTVVTGDEPEGNVHPGMWLIAAACLFGAAMPILMSSGPSAEARADMQGAVDGGGKVGKNWPGKRPGKFGPLKGGPYKFGLEGKSRFRHAGEARSAADAGEDLEEDPEQHEDLEEEIVEVEVEEEGDEGSDGKGRGKGPSPRSKDDPEVEKTASQLLTEAKAAYSKGRAAEAYKLAGESNRKRQSTDALTVKAKAACKMGNEGAAKKAFEALPMGAARRDVRPVCRDKGIRLGL